MKHFFQYLSILTILVIPATSGVSALTYSKGEVAQDISWPNCKTLSFTPSNIGIVGVNGGLGFYPNPCVGSEAALYKQNLSLYVNTGFPGSPYDLKFKSQPLSCSTNNVGCLAYNYGYNAGKYAVNYSLSRGIVSNNWWLDVETVNSWSSNTAYNKNSLKGEIDAVTESLKPESVGYYSYPAQWQSITGSWQNKMPKWLATDSNYKSVAENECKGLGFNGGVTLMTQYIGQIDLDLIC